MPFDELFDQLVENDRIPCTAPRTLATLKRCDLEDWTAEQQDGSTYASTIERDVDQVVEAG
ncbi:hypothetical protein OHQ88_34055 (plasmid) [Micromonospora zamorensis]|uniref:hypothetical protein n=1 Tax=Micromonospora zamorensis TaxID=709883 RepID=UPI002E219B8C